MRGVPGGVRAGRKPKEDSDETIIGPLMSVPPLPAYLQPAANKGCTVGRERWFQIFKILIDRQSVGGEHIQAVEQLCFCYLKLAKIQSIIDLDGEVIRGRDNKASKVHPLLKERSSMLILIRGYLHDFGMIPPKGSQSTGKIVNGPAVRKVSDSPFDDE